MGAKTKNSKPKSEAGPANMPRADLCLILETDMSLVAPTCKAIAGIARPFLPLAQLNSFELALNEAITNAIEHGNLGITESEKLQLCEIGMLEAERAKRAEVAKKNGKLVTVKAQFESNSVCIKIVDVGAGFDWKQQRPATTELDPSGRGLRIISRFFDEVIYNEKGNEQTLVKRTV